MTDDVPSPAYFSGEDELAALLLAMVIDHCAGYSRDDQRAGLTSYLHAPHTTEDDLDSYGSAANADAMTALPRQLVLERELSSTWRSVSPRAVNCKRWLLVISMLFLPREGQKKTTKFLRCRAAKGRPAFAIRGFSRAISSLHVAIKRLKQRKEKHHDEPSPLNITSP